MTETVVCESCNREVQRDQAFTRVGIGTITGNTRVSFLCDYCAPEPASLDDGVYEIEEDE